MAVKWIVVAVLLATSCAGAEDAADDAAEDGSPESTTSATSTTAGATETTCERVERLLLDAPFDQVSFAWEPPGGNLAIFDGDVLREYFDLDLLLVGALDERGEDYVGLGFDRDDELVLADRLDWDRYVDLTLSDERDLLLISVGDGRPGCREAQ